MVAPTAGVVGVVGVVGAVISVVVGTIYGAVAGYVGGRVDAVFYCPHTPDDKCHCRKPAPGLFEQFLGGQTGFLGGAKAVIDVGLAANDFGVRTRRLFLPASCRACF